MNKIGHSSRSSSIQWSKTTEEVSGNVKQFKKEKKKKRKKRKKKEKKKKNKKKKSIEGQLDLGIELSEPI